MGIVQARNSCKESRKQLAFTFPPCCFPSPSCAGPHMGKEADSRAENTVTEHSTYEHKTTEPGHTGGRTAAGPRTAALPAYCCRHPGVFQGHLCSSHTQSQAHRHTGLLGSAPIRRRLRAEGQPQGSHTHRKKSLESPRVVRRGTPTGIAQRTWG